MAHSVRGTKDLATKPRPSKWRQRLEDDHYAPLGQVLLHAAYKYKMLEQTIEQWNKTTHDVQDSVTDSNPGVEALLGPKAYWRILREKGVYLPDANGTLNYRPGLHHCFTGECRGRTFETKQEYLDHTENDHPGASKCTVCAGEFSTSHACNEHVENSHIPRAANIQKVDAMEILPAISIYDTKQPVLQRIKPLLHPSRNILADAEESKSKAGESVYAKDSAYYSLETIRTAESSVGELLSAAVLAVPQPVKLENMEAYESPPMNTDETVAFAGSEHDTVAFLLQPELDSPSELAGSYPRDAKLGLNTPKIGSRLRDHVHAQDYHNERQTMPWIRKTQLANDASNLDDGNPTTHDSHSASVSTASNSSEAFQILQDMRKSFKEVTQSEINRDAHQLSDVDDDADFTDEVEEAGENGESSKQGDRGARTGSWNSNNSSRKRAREDNNGSDAGSSDDLDDKSRKLMRDFDNNFPLPEKPQIPCPVPLTSVVGDHDAAEQARHACFGTDSSMSESLRSVLKRHGLVFCPKCCNIISTSRIEQQTGETGTIVSVVVTDKPDAVWTKHKSECHKTRCINEKCRAAHGRSLLDIAHDLTHECKPAWQGKDIPNEHLWRFVAAKIHKTNNIITPRFEVGPGFKHTANLAQRAICPQRRFAEHFRSEIRAFLMERQDLQRQLDESKLSREAELRSLQEQHQDKLRELHDIIEELCEVAAPNERLRRKIKRVVPEVEFAVMPAKSNGKISTHPTDITSDTTPPASDNSNDAALDNTEPAGIVNEFHQPYLQSNDDYSNYNPFSGGNFHYDYTPGAGDTM